MKELLDYIGYEVKEGEEPEFKQVKELFDSKFVPKSRISEELPEVKSLIDENYGKAMKRAEIAFQTAVKKSGVEIPHSEFDQFQRAEDKFDFGLKKLSETIKASKGEANEAIEQQIKDLTSERDRYKNEYGTIRDEYENFKTEIGQKEKTRAVNDFQKELFNKVKWRQSASDLEKTGFKEVFKKNYSFVPSEEGKIEIRTKNGERIANPDRADQYLSPTDIIERAAKESGVWDMEPHKGKKKPEPRRPDKGVDDPPKRNINPNAGLKRKPRFNAMG